MSTKNTVFQVIHDRVWRKIKGWKERCLSRAGREVLLKSVQAIPTYAMLCNASSCRKESLTAWTLCIGTFGGGKWVMKGSLPSLPGENCASRRMMVDWVWGTCEHSIWPCWQNNSAGSSPYLTLLQRHFWHFWKASTFHILSTHICMGCENNP